MTIALAVLLIAIALLAALLAARISRLSRRLSAAQAENAGLHAELRRVEAEALRLQTVRRDFVANISHELRTPLASIKLLVETLEGGALHDGTVAAEFTHKIGQETNHLIAMTQELLDLARLEAAPAMRPDDLDVTDLVAEVVERMRPLAADNRVTLRALLPSDLPRAWADRAQVGRVFVNLLNNAITFTPPGGVVTISGGAEPGRVACSVSDTGPGIPPGEEARIFERFYKADTARQRGGSGLGLSIARHIVEAQGGRIWASNQETGGACVTFTLPVMTQYIADASQSA